MTKKLPILWLTGNSGAGKTTLAEGLKQHFESTDTHHPLYRRIVILDGDQMRASISVDEGFSPEDRRRHNLRVARLATELQSQGFLVVVAVIAPFQSVRDELDTICSPLWIYLKRSGLGAKDRPYEAPLHPDLLIDNDMLSIDEARMKALQFLERITVSSETAEALLGSESLPR